MFNHTTDAKAFVTAACTLAIALLTIGMGVNSTWAGSDQQSGLQSTHISSQVVIPPTPPPAQASPDRLLPLHRTAQASPQEAARAECVHRCDRALLTCLSSAVTASTKKWCNDQHANCVGRC